MTTPDTSDSESESHRKLDQFDWSKMRFATDRVTVASLRKQSECDFGFRDRLKILESNVFDDLESVMGLERELAHIAYCQAAGVPEAEAGITFSDRGQVVMRLLFEEYDRLGITAGRIESKQWIQSIEAQARVQARPFLSKGRG